MINHPVTTSIGTAPLKQAALQQAEDPRILFFRSVDRYISDLGKELIIKMVEILDKPVEAHNLRVTALQTNYDSLEWSSFKMFSKLWTGLKVLYLNDCVPDTVEIIDLDPDYWMAYQAYGENSNTLTALALAQNLGLVTINHVPDSSRGDPFATEWHPASVTISERGRAYAEQLRKVN